VLETELLLPLVPGHRLAADQVSALQRIEQRRQAFVIRPDQDKRAVPEDAPGDGGREQDRTFGGGDRVEPGRDDPADAGRELAAGG